MFDLTGSGWRRGRGHRLWGWRASVCACRILEHERIAPQDNSEARDAPFDTCLGQPRIAGALSGSFLSAPLPQPWPLPQP